MNASLRWSAMRRFVIGGLSTMIFGFAPAWASDAETSASAGRTHLGGGSASATARYEGDVGFARTQSTSGAVSSARGVAVGLDEDGLSLSISRAVSTPRGPAIATNFSLSIGTDGGLAANTSLSRANGPLEASATAGGRVSTGERTPLGRTPPVAVGMASGRSDPWGRVQATSHAVTSRGVPVRVTPVVAHQTRGWGR
jgi:hypothetical protein